MNYNSIISDLINTMDKVALDSVLIPGSDICCSKYAAPIVAEGYWIPKISRVQYNGNTTIVFFNDGTKATVKLSENDVYDRKTAIVYAIVKRMLGKVKSDSMVDGNGFGTALQKIADAGFDQVKAKKEQEENKRKAHAAHVIKQEKAKKAAFERKVRARAREIAIEEAARKLVNEKNILNEDTSTTTTLDNSKGCNTCEFIDKKTSTCKNKTWVDSPSEVYIRPDKPFSQFTHEEKKEYWRNQYKNRKNK